MSNTNRDALVVLQARAGDRDSLEQLLSGVQGRLRGYIVGVVGATAADDVLQDTLITICRNLKWLRDPELFLPWAYRIASRSCFKTLKRDRRFTQAEDDTRFPEESTTVTQPELQLFSEVPELLQKISPASRAVLSLHYLRELSIHEVAAILEIGVGTAKSRLAYGLSCLRKLVTEKEEL